MPIWSLAEAINAGVLAAGNDLIAKTDADILISPDSRAEFDDTVAGIAGGAFAMAVTQAIDLH